MPVRATTTLRLPKMMVPVSSSHVLDVRLLQRATMTTRLRLTMVPAYSQTTLVRLVTPTARSTRMTMTKMVSAMRTRRRVVRILPLVMTAPTLTPTTASVSTLRISMEWITSTVMATA